MWQPIETAPKDGSYVLLFGSFCKGDHAPKTIYTLNWSETETLEDAGDGLYRKVKSGRWGGACDFQATHWMPLPAPPTETAERELDDDEALMPGGFQ